jgi:hypothetical protein
MNKPADKPEAPETEAPEAAAEVHVDANGTAWEPSEAAKADNP